MFYYPIAGILFLLPGKSLVKIIFWEKYPVVSVAQKICSYKDAHPKSIIRTELRVFCAQICVIHKRDLCNPRSILRCRGINEPYLDLHRAMDNPWLSPLKGVFP